MSFAHVFPDINLIFNHQLIFYKYFYHIQISREQKQVVEFTLLSDITNHAKSCY